MAPEALRGGLPVPYHAGPGAARVHLAVQSSWDTVPLYDVIGRIPGAGAGGDADEWVIRGNHHDAWVNGAQDPVSGTVVLLEEARALAALAKQGWRPRRTVVFGVWDGEEEGFIGSTEWVEAHESELRRAGVAYVNSDVNERGTLWMSGSHVLERALNGAARDVTDPETRLSVWKRKQLSLLAEASSPDERTELRTRADLRLVALGAGTDYTAFVDHAGVASLNIGFGGEDDGGIYHSAYDDLAWFSRFSDSDFAYGRALAQTAGTVVMRLADADVLPFDLGAVADAAERYVKDVKEMLDKKRGDAQERNREIDEGVFAATSDPRHPTFPPPRAEPPPPIDFATLDGAVRLLRESARRNARAVTSLLARAGDAGTAAAIAQVNQRLLQTERRLTSDEGLSQRPWYRHLLYAPGVYTGYAPATLPGVRDAIEAKRWDEARDEILRVAAALTSEAGLLDAASSEAEAPR
jgi:N-acetylated-alpha-linked acidic dipeptidase